MNQIFFPVFCQLIEILQITVILFSDLDMDVKLTENLRADFLGLRQNAECSYSVRLPGFPSNAKQIKISIGVLFKNLKKIPTAEEIFGSGSNFCVFNSTHLLILLYKENNFFVFLTVAETQITVNN